MGGVNLRTLDDWDGYRCPWCDHVELIAGDDARARRQMQEHLDGHMAHPIGRPVPEVAE